MCFPSPFRGSAKDTPANEHEYVQYWQLKNPCGLNSCEAWRDSQALLKLAAVLMEASHELQCLAWVNTQD